MSEDDFERIASLADHSAHTGTGEKLSSLSRECKRLVEVDNTSAPVAGVHNKT